jgi:serine/threonine protein kinase
VIDSKDKSAPGEPDSDASATHAGVKPLSQSRVDTLSIDFLARLRTGRRYEIGETLASRFRIVRDLDDGGMGQVFVAENLSIGRNVAIKVLKPELLANEEFRKRFQKEADAIAAIAHQNVVRFFDLVVGDPTFLVMEYVEGPTLSAVLKMDERLDPLRATELARRLCWGLDAAHRAGVIHRDVKPSNIILAPDAESREQPKLIDFGVAKLTSQPADVQLTRHGQIVGTPHYMCPEQITGGEIDARSDVYSLGCVLYHMIAGRPPFVGLEEYQILSQHVERAAEPVGEVVPGVPPELQRVLQRALAKAPSSRFDSMQEMARALAAVPGLAQPGRIPSESATRSMPRPAGLVRTTPSRAQWMVAALLAGLAGLGGGWLLHRGSTPFGSGLIVSSEPPGATVELDGHRLAETTPTAVRGLAAGAHRLRLQLDGHADVERNVSVRAGERTLVELALAARSHRVSVKSAPSGATVFLDGRVVAGTTPTVMTVTDDDFHELRLERSGYEVLTHSLKPEDRQPELQLVLEPEKEPQGMMTVDGPSAAEVWVDGAFTGFTTPTLGFRVPAGEHVVALRTGDSRSAPTKVVIKQGDHVHLTLSLLDRGKP